MFKLILICLCIILTVSIELTLKIEQPALSMKLKISERNFYQLLSNMIIYDKNTKILNQTGHDHSYHNFLEVQFIQTGIYPICFEKFHKKLLLYSLIQLGNNKKMLTAGKQDINKLSKTISQFLTDIRKTVWEFKQLLENQDQMKIRLIQNEASNYWMFAAKMGLMVIISLIQFYAVKYIFQ